MKSCNPLNGSIRDLILSEVLKEKTDDELLAGGGDCAAGAEKKPDRFFVASVAARNHFPDVARRWRKAGGVQ